MTLQLSRQAARDLLMTAQGLDHPRSNPALKADVLETIRQINALQIDTINVVSRSPYFILWSRLGDYRMEWLDDLLAEGELFEYWSHAACFLPREDYGFYRRIMLDGLHTRRYSQGWQKRNARLIAEVLERIQREGAVRSSDFKSDHKPAGGWWNWKEEKHVLEYLFTRGDLMIARRQNFQRVYDLRQRVLPGWDDSETPSSEETLRALTLKAVKSLGVATSTWAINYFYMPKKGMAQRLESLAAEGFLLPAAIEGEKDLAYVHPDYRQQAEKAASGELNLSLTTLLSPFDPLITDRQRTKELFDFEYSIECYLPASKRRYGYYTLPILHKGAFIGRMDPKAHRKEGIFEIKSLHLEPGVEIESQLVFDLVKTILACARWHQTPRVIVRQSDPPELAAELTEKFASREKEEPNRL